MSSDSENNRKTSKHHKTIGVLISCCLFLTITSVCLLISIILIGKHLISNSNLDLSSRHNLNNKFPSKFLYYRLPNDTIPKKYTIFLKPNLQSGQFNGIVNITFEILKNRKNFILHCKNLQIDEIKLRKLNDSKILMIENVKKLKMEEVLIIKPKRILKKGTYRVDFVYHGSMVDKTIGLYRSKYGDEDEEQPRYIATSKFEPTYARQAFPCFDEPNLKATYKVHLLKPKDDSYTALSNYPQIKEEETSDGVMVEFEETVPMSTYLSCFIVSDFQYTNTTFLNDDKEIPFRVYASPHQLNKTEYAGLVGKKSIEYYIKYFNIPYPLPKLDMVAIPDFVSGAMEHWGLVTFRETALLYDSTTHSESNKQRVAEVVAHELAHSWFGNLVTMDWWNNLWLNEGFATYIAVKGVGAAEPTWQMMEQFQIETLHSILSLDATQGSHPIIQTVETPDQITEVFDAVSYNKGASVLRMLESVVNAENFQKGVTNYLNRHKYGNAITQDLWDEIQKVVGDGLNVTEFMDCYTLQMGYPIVDVKIENDGFVLTQKRFLKDYGSVVKQKKSPLNYKWNIPISFITDKDASKSTIYWFSYKNDILKIDKPKDTKWIKFNPGQIGYYRVNYNQEMWINLIENINQMSVSDRCHLLEESFSIAESGDLNYEIPLNLTKYLQNETEYIPWSIASSQFQQLEKLLQTSEFYSDFQNYVINLLKPIYDSLTWDDSDETEPHLTKLARVVILNLACVMNYDDALTQAKAYFDHWIANTDDVISPNLRSIVYKYGMVSADEETWFKVFEIFATETDANEKLKLMNGLANVRNPTLLTKLIELAKDETYVRSQDYFTLLQYISGNPVGSPIVWDYVRENWSYLVDRFTLNDRYLGRLIPSITSRFSTNIKLDEMKHFFAKYPEAGAGAAARLQALETVSNNIKWLENYKVVVENWINDNNKI